MAQSVNDIVKILKGGQSLRAVPLPIYRLADQELVGYELLSRGPAGPYERPDVFLRISAEHNILTQVDLDCLRVCLETAKQLQPKGMFHINLFPSTIMETPTNDLLRMFPEPGKNGTFCIEIVEHRIVGSPEHLRSQVESLRGGGVLLAIDDVGCGASCLETLIILEPDIIKLDRVYVTNASKSNVKRARLKRLVNVARVLGADMVAEGIETREDLEFLQELGVSYGQGILWGAIP